MKWLLRLMIWLHPSEVHLGAYADGELGELDAYSVSHHLLQCGRCKEIVESRLNTLRMLRSVCDEAGEGVIEAMAAAGRLNLVRRIGGEEARPSVVCGMDARVVEAAGAIFGCRIPATYPDELDGAGGAPDRRLDQMCVAMLGSRFDDPHDR